MIKKGIKSAFPVSLSPMLCTLTKEPVTDPGYVHEIKFDGYRIMAFVDKTKVVLRSRGGLDYTSKYPTIVNALQKLSSRVVLDGEVCALDADGRPNFDTLQKPPAGTEIVFYAFDIPWFDGYNLQKLPLLERKKILKKFTGKNKVIRYSDHFTDGKALFEETKKLGMEGIVSKQAESTYQPGSRGSAWYKTPTEMRQEFVIGGWVESERGRLFASLLFGVYKKKRLHWVGHAGGGFKDKDMKELYKKLQPLEISSSPFDNHVAANGRVHWVKPKLVANFKFAGFTKSGRIRKPAIFLGLRYDKNPEDVKQENVVKP